MDDFNLDDENELDALKEKQSRGDLMKGVLSGMGGMLQSQANVPSAYEYLYKKTGNPTDFQGTFDKMAGSIKDPMDQSRKAMEYVKQKREGRLANEQDAASASKKDPNSTASKAAKQIAGRFGIQVTPEMSAYDVEQLMDPKKMMEAEAMSQVNFGNQVELEKLRQKGDMQKLGAQLSADRNKKNEPTKLPPDKVLAVNEGNSIPTMLKDIGASIDNNPNAFGPLVGRMRGMNPYDETAQALQSQVKASSQAFGRYMEGGVLRKEDEAKYEKMFPQASDTPATAKNKLAIVNKLLVDKQKSNLSALKSSGYDTSGVEGTDLGAGQTPSILSGTGPANDDGKVEMFAPDGTRKRVPKAQVQAALAKGGKLVNGTAVGAK